ncbi:MAG: putative cardiolipin synthase [Flavobacteriales bacterium]|jgi:putative cardiolipin synthase
MRNSHLHFQFSLKSWTFLVCSILCIASCKDNPKDHLPKAEFCSLIHSNAPSELDKYLQPLDSLMQENTGAYVLEDGGGALVTRAWLCENAQETIDIQYFIFSTDNVGLIACDYLVHAADRGVKVRILVDDIMVDADIEDVLMLDSHENIDIKIYNPGVNLGKNLFAKLKKFATDFRGANQRMHNKTFTVDGAVVITGGRNVADEYFDYDHEYNFRDRDILFMGQAANEVKASFADFWTSRFSHEVTSLVDNLPEGLADSSRFDNLHEYACDPGNFWPQVREEIENLPQMFTKLIDEGKILWMDSVQFISDKPGKNDGSHGLEGGGVTTDTLVSILARAQISVDIQSPYLITTEASRALFKAAVDRGVRVRILTNSLASTDNIEAFSSYQTDRETLLVTGVEIYEFRPDAKERMDIMTGELQEKLNYSPIFGLHAKTMIVDGRITVIGTFNLDPRSANLNTECLVVLYSKELTSKVQKGIDLEFRPENSWRISGDFNPDEEVSKLKRISTWTRKIIPKEIL